MSGEAWLYLFAVIINAVNLFLQVFFTIMYSDLEWYELLRRERSAGVAWIAVGQQSGSGLRACWAAPPAAARSSLLGRQC